MKSAHRTDAQERAEPGADSESTSDHQVREDREISTEQQHLDVVYARLDRMRASAERRLQQTLRESGGTPQARSERESYERLYTDDLTKFDAAEHNLYFGRLDMGSGETRAIGRIGILDDDSDDTTLLLDWRAPLSRPFYLATPAAPEEVRRRRHIRTRSRAVRGISDEVLESDSAVADAPAGGDVVNETALISALNAARTGEMTDIVETIQREQDLIIRSPHRGVMVVQGGPGTGKTAVALHRAAYLLYTHRDVLARSGVLIIGPNDDFLTYIGQVLPSLGETGVLLSTIGNLYPGVRASVVEPRLAAALKGDLRMVDVLKRAVREYQTVPRQPVTVTFDGYPLTIDKSVIQPARGRARSSRRPHNRARSVFIRNALDALAEQHARRIGSSTIDGSQLLSRGDIADIRDEMRTDPDILTALGEFWPPLTPQKVITELFGSTARLRKVTTGWTDDERTALLRDHHRPVADVSAADVPLLDEVAELIGYDTDGESERDRVEWRHRLAEAQDALDILTGSAPQDLEDELDPEILMAYDVIDAEQLASRQVQRERLTTAERAYGDRTWAFGHVIVDEAQEISAMGWRMIMRRIPNRWMTIIGDTAQTSDPAGTTSWDAVLHPYVADRWRRHDLTVNYRTPGEIMDSATTVLAQIAPDQPAPTSIRRSGHPPQDIRTDSADDTVTTAVRVALEAGAGPGVVAVIVPDLLADVVDASMRTASAEFGDDTPAPRVLTVGAVKGLEFDMTVVVEPAALVAQSDRGLGDLYVALTRATQRLAVVHAEELPLDLLS